MAVVQALIQRLRLSHQIGHPSPKSSGFIRVGTVSVHTVALARRGAAARAVEATDLPAVHGRRMQDFRVRFDVALQRGLFWKG
jgi:hypothetical protein